MRYRRFAIRDRSLRVQIVAIMLVLLTASFVAVAAATALSLRSFLYQRLDQQLVAAGNRFSVTLEHPSDNDADDSDRLTSVEGQAAGTLGARVVDGRVTAFAVIAHDRAVPAASPADTATVARLRPSKSVRSIRFADLGEYRVLVTAGDDGDVLVTGLPERPVHETISRLLGIELVVYAAALVAIGVATAVSVRWSLRPLHRVASAARDVANRPLSEGVVALPERALIDRPNSEAGQVADAFNHMLEHVEVALRKRQASEENLRQFIADASHELRTPVAVVRSQAEYAQRADPSLSPIARDALSRITTESERMGRLVQDLLLLARLDAGRDLDEVPVDLTRVVLEAANDARIISSDHTWRVDVPARELVVYGDPDALQQVVANLVTNARTHTPAGTTVTISLEQVGGSVRLAVADDGPGIPDDIVPRLFDRFVRAEIPRARPDGSGLGLAIVAAIVAAHRGRVDVVSEPGATRFTVVLPVRSDLGR